MILTRFSSAHFLFGLVTTLVISSPAIAAKRSELSPGLAAHLKSGSITKLIEVIVELDEAILFDQEAEREIANLNDDRAAQEELIERIAKERAPSLFRLIDVAVDQGGDVGYFWLLNRLALKAPGKIIKKLANTKGVQKMYFSRPDLNGAALDAKERKSSEPTLEQILERPRKVVVVEADYDNVQKGATSGWKVQDPEDHYIDLKKWIEGGMFYLTNPDGSMAYDWWYLGAIPLPVKDDRGLYRTAIEGIGSRGQMRGTIILKILDERGDSILMQFIREDIDSGEIRKFSAKCMRLLEKV